MNCYVEFEFSIQFKKHKNEDLPFCNDLALKLGVGEGGHFFLPFGGMLVIPDDDIAFLSTWDCWCIICIDEEGADDEADVATGISPNLYHVQCQILVTTINYLLLGH